MWLNRHKTLVSAIIVGVIACLLAFGAVIPLLQRIGQLTAKIESKTKEMEDLERRVSILTQLDMNVLAERVAVLDRALPPKKDILLYLAAINGLSNELGLSFGGINLEPGELTEATGSGKKSIAQPGLSSLETEIKIQGDQDKIYAFMRAIEEVVPLMQIDDIKVTVVGDNQYSLSLTLGMLWAPSVTEQIKGPVTLFGEQEEKYFQQLAGFRDYPQIVEQFNPGDTGTKSDIFSPLTLQP